MKIVSKLFLSCIKYILPLVAGYTTLAQPKGFDVLDYHYVDNTERLISATAFSVLNTEDRVITAGYTGKYYIDRLRYSNYVSIHSKEGERISHRKLLIPDCWNSTIEGFSSLLALSTNKLVAAGAGGNFYIRPLNPLYGIEQPFLYFFNSNGDSLDLKVYVDSFRGRNILSLTKDGDAIIAAGYITSEKLYYNDFAKEYSAASTSFWLAKFDLEGNMRWQKEFPQTVSESYLSTARRIIPASDGSGYLIAGIQGALSVIIKTDTAGNYLWRKTMIQPLPVFESLWGGQSLDIAPATDGGCYFVSSDPTEVYNDYFEEYIPSERIYYGRLSPVGDTVWTRTYLYDTVWGFARGNGMQVAANGDLIIIARGETLNYKDRLRSQYSIVMRTDSMGNVKWYREPIHYDFKSTNHTTNNLLFGLSLGSDGSIAAAGEYVGKADPSQSAEEANAYPWIILMDSLGRRCDIDTVTLAAVYPCERIPGADPYLPDTLFTLYPNPTRDKINILMTGTTGYIPIKNKVKMGIFDMSGRQIHQQIIGSEFTTIDISQYPQGMYMVQIWIDKRKAQYWKVAKY